MKTVNVPDSHINKSTILTMVEDGWTVHAGPWGSSATDRTVTLHKVCPELGGYFKVWFVDRDVQVRDTIKHYFTHAVWFVSDNGRTRHERSFKVVSPEDYDFSSYVHAAGVCDLSGEYHGIENLVPVGFSNAVAPDYVDKFNSKFSYTS
jgi:hypothetical protein